MKKILIIEDEKDIRESVADILRLHNYKVVEAANGNEGLIAALSHFPDLIISDVLMPGFDGFQLMEHLQNNKRFFNVPIIFLTAKSQPDDFRKGLKLGAADYITKPFKMEELLASIKKQLTKIENQRQVEQNYFLLAFENPFIGVFYFVNEEITQVNQKFVQMTGYSLPEIKRLNMENLFAGNSNDSIAAIMDCYKGIRSEVFVDTIIITKEKQALEATLYVKNISTEETNAVFGNFYHKANTVETESNGNEIHSLIEFFRSTDNMKVMQEVMNASKILDLEEKKKQTALQEKISITAREMDVLRLICDGLTNNEIAEKLFLSNRTVDNHRASLLLKTETKNTAALVAFAIKNKLID